MTLEEKVEEALADTTTAEMLAYLREVWTGNHDLVGLFRNYPCAWQARLRGFVDHTGSKVTLAARGLVFLVIHNER